VKLVRLVFSGWLAWLVGCGGAVGNPSWRAGPAPAETFQPSRELVPAQPPAPRYNDRAAAGAAPLVPDAQELVDRVAEAARASGLVAPTVDPRLVAATSDLARLKLRPETPLPYPAIQFALTHHGIVEPVGYLQKEVAIGGDVKPVILDLASRAADALRATPYARIGAGVAQDGKNVVVVIAMQPTTVTTEPIPRELPRGGACEVRGKLASPFADPEVYVTGQRGQVARLPLTHEGASGFRAEVRCGEGEGRLQVEIVGYAPGREPTVLANFPVYCGTAAPQRLELADPGADAAMASGDIESLAREGLALVNRDRAQNGLAPLAWDDRAAAVARAHAEEMRDKNFVAHLSPTTGTSADRVRRAGIATPLVLENVARAGSPAEVEQGLMDSPGHRANLLSRDATHVGIGVALTSFPGEPRELYVTQLFLRINAVVDRAEARRRAVAAVLAARSAAGLPELTEDRDLDDIAAAHAEALAARLQPQQELDRIAEQKLGQLPARFQAVRSVVVITANLDEPSKDAASDAAARRFGLGVAQGFHPDLGENAFYVVLLLAEPRR
jgi:uncharacterized protein YkwD